MAAPVAVELSAGILTVTLDRADKRNALSSAVVEGLHDTLERADLDADVRVVLLRGEGKDFCAGADLEELLASADRSPGDNEASAARLGAVFTRMRRMPKPVVGIVHGRALAGGAGLATACDIVVAGASAQFGYPEIQRGFVPAMVMTLLRRLAGEKAALDLVLTGRLVGAEEARTLGLVSRVVPDTRAGGGRAEDRGSPRDGEPVRGRLHQAALFSAGRKGIRGGDRPGRAGERHRAADAGLPRGDRPLPSAMTAVRLGLAIAGFVAAVLTVVLDSPRLGWGAIALLLGSLIVRLIQRAGPPDD